MPLDLDQGIGHDRRRHLCQIAEGVADIAKHLGKAPADALVFANFDGSAYSPNLLSKAMAAGDEGSRAQGDTA